jgi:transcriptional regulator with XRE-family HTH domain
MELRESTARTRELGAELRKAREAARYTGHELAKKLGWSPSKVSRIETGARGTSEVDAAIYLAFCGVMGSELHRVLDLARQADDNNWLHVRGERLPDQLRSLVVQETTAQFMLKFDPLVIPGLVQTEDYARALFRASKVMPEEAVESQVRARMDRQRLLRSQDPPRITFYVHENALCLPMGNHRVMHEQLLHLVLLCTASPFSVRVVRAGFSEFAGVGPFTWFAHADHNPVIYAELLTTSLFLEGRDNIDAYRRILDLLSDLALDEAHSRSFLATLASDHDRPEEGGI